MNHEICKKCRGGCIYRSNEKYPPCAQKAIKLLKESLNQLEEDYHTPDTLLEKVRDFIGENDGIKRQNN